MDQRQPQRGLTVPAAYRTALRRAALSAPARRAVEDGLCGYGTVLDFGCGLGGDVDRLRAGGVDARGWDPHHRSDPPPSPADTVLCTYVLNVVESPADRLRTAREAWRLARRALAVAVRGTGEERHLARAEEHRDGRLTRRGTFHHLFAAAELVELLQDATGARPVPVTPSLAYVFRDAADSTAYLARRFGGVRPEDADHDGEILARTASFLAAHGREPVAEEAPDLAAAARRAYGGIAAAVAAARPLVDDEHAERAARRRAGDLLVVLSMARFHGEVRAADLPAPLRADATAFLGGPRGALRRSDELLVALGSPDRIRRAVRLTPVGKTSPTALYVHVSAEHQLPPLLRVYGQCAALIVGRPEATTLVKLHHDRAAVSFLDYPDFDRDPHPRLSRSLLVDLRSRAATATAYSTRDNRPLLHRKEEFLLPSDPRSRLYRKLTAQEARAGLYDRPEAIGLERGWQAELDRTNRSHRGHRLIRRRDG